MDGAAFSARRRSHSLIDLHFHALPGVDDGPAGWDDALALCRAAEAEGTETVVATPHVLRDPWLNEDPAPRRALVAELNTRLGGRPRVLEGSEVWFGDDLVELWEKGPAGPLTALAGSRALLVEFPPGWVSPRAGEVFHELRVLGVVPVVAHPERNIVFAREPERLAALVDRGAVVQVTAASLLGEAGRAALAAAEAFLKAEMVHLVASDAHSMAARPPRLAAARERVRRERGAEVEEGLFVANPKALLAGEELPWPG